MILGLDIGRQYIKAVVLEKHKKGHKFVNAGIRLVTDTHQAYDPEKVSQPLWVMATNELMKEMKINPKKVKNLVSGLSGTQVSIKQITTMDMPQDEFHSAMTFEARKHIPMDGSDAVIDYQVLGSNRKEVDKVDVVLVACTKKTSANHLDLLREIGFKPGILDSNPLAAMNAFSYVNELPDEGAVVLLDVGAVSSSLMVLDRQNMLFTRDIPIGNHEFVKALATKLDKDYLSAADELNHNGVSSFEQSDGGDDSFQIGIADRNIFDNFVEDIRRSLRYYAKMTNQSFFTHIYLTGGASSILGLSKFIQGKLNIEASEFNPLTLFDGYDSDSVINPPQYTVAAGLALHGGGLEN